MERPAREALVRGGLVGIEGKELEMEKKLRLERNHNKRGRGTQTGYSKKNRQRNVPDLQSSCGGTCAPKGCEKADDIIPLFTHNGSHKRGSLQLRSGGFGGRSR